MNFKKLIPAVALLLTVSTSAQAMSMRELFNSINAMGNVSKPAVLQGQTLQMYSGGSLFMRSPNKTYNLANITPPKWSAGCGGIDLFMGGFSFINKEQFVAMMRNIGSNALGYSFKLAIQNLCPTCDNVMQALQATANTANRLNIDSCEAAKGIVNAAIPDSWTRDRANTAKAFGVDSNIFDDLTSAWTNVMGNENRANQTINDATRNDERLKESAPTGNIVWKALKKVNGIDDEYRMILMSMIGTVIFNTEEGSSVPQYLERKPITVQNLVQGTDAGSERLVAIPIYRCDSMAADGCLHPYDGTVSQESFRYMVRQKMYQITDAIANRSQYANAEETMAFLNVTDLPVYKMLAVGTTYGNSAMADAMTGRYEELIAAKYAEVYITRAVKDLRLAVANYSGATTASTSQALERLSPQLGEILEEARGVLQTAYQQTISTFSIAQEVAHMERVVNSNLSQVMRNSLAFGRSLKGG